MISTFTSAAIYKGAGGVGDIMIYVQPPDEPSNIESVSSRALASGEEIDDAKA